MKVYTYKVTDDAATDAKEIFDWYQDKSLGLGTRFLTHLEKGFRNITLNPLAFANTGFSDFRRFILDVFPYKIFYILKDDTIIITAIIHKSRSRYYWRRKLKKRK